MDASKKRDGGEAARQHAGMGADGENQTNAGGVVGNLIRDLRIAAGITQSELARRINCSKAQLSLMESGQRAVSLNRARQIEKALGIADGRIASALQWQQVPAPLRHELQSTQSQSQNLVSEIRKALSGDAPLDELRQLIEQSNTNIQSPQLMRHARGIPVINKVAAGYPAEFTDLDYPRAVADEYIACPDVSDPDAFAARVVGDSMEPAYREGDLVIFSPLLPTPAGSDCFVRFEPGNESTFKRVYFEDEGRVIRLQPLNSAYAPRLVDREAVNGLYAAAYVMRRVGAA